MVRKIVNGWLSDLAIVGIVASLCFGVGFSVLCVADSWVSRLIAFIVIVSISLIAGLLSDWYLHRLFGQTIMTLIFSISFRLRRVGK